MSIPSTIISIFSNRLSMDNPRIDLSKMDQQLNRIWNKQLRHRKERNKAATTNSDNKFPWEKFDSGKLTMKDFIAMGAYSSVYKGVYNDQTVAVKVFDCGKREAIEKSTVEKWFKEEVEVWCHLDHPNITKFIGAGMENQCLILIEYIDGGTLKSYLRKQKIKRRKLGYDTVIQLALDLARGLSYLHSKNIMHRDIKPDNLLLDQDRKLKITDFGIAQVEALYPDFKTTEDLGTPCYKAPEVINKRPYNRKCDVYSFGICLWEMYCCDQAFKGMDVDFRVVSENLRPEIPKQCPRDLADLIKKCWNEDPNKRPEMEQVVAALEAMAIASSGLFCSAQGLKRKCKKLLGS